MKNIAVLITKLYEDSEYTEPAKALEAQGYKLVHIGLKAGEVVNGKKGQSSVKIDKTADQVQVDDFDGLLIPGGFSPDILRADDKVVEFTREFAKSGKPIFAICHGPQLLITAEVLKGRTITGYKSIWVDIKNAGATFVDQEVVVDNNLVTSRTPKDLPAFISAMLKVLEK